MSRGIRNNNPGNIDYSPRNKWLGELPFNAVIEPRHSRFTAPEYGIRALFKLLRTYSKYPGKPGVGCENIDTVEEIIERWAPPKDRNNTEGYITRVCKETGFGRRDCLDVYDKQTAFRLAKAIIQVENASQPYADAIFEQAWSLL
ncbi:TPA: structural protein [Morganella morganii]